MAERTDEITVEDVPVEHRYVARDADGTVVGKAEYQLARDLVVFTHTEVDPSMEGRGVGSLLARGALDGARASGVKVLLLCPFIKAYVGRHREYVDLVYGAPESKVTD